jgi:hypothetical protein
VFYKSRKKLFTQAQLVTLISGKGTRNFAHRTWSVCPFLMTQIFFSVCTSPVVHGFFVFKNRIPPFLPFDLPSFDERATGAVTVSGMG